MANTYHKKLKRQVYFVDSVKRAVIFQFKYGLQLPAGELYNRFGYSKIIGSEIDYKTHKNFFYGIRGDYWFGKTVKDSVLNKLTTNVGIITKYGDVADVRLSSMGMHFGLQVGKIFAIPAINKNSGIALGFGSGYMMHKIRIINKQLDVPQLSTAYKKGYDRLTGGPYLSQTLSYFNMSNSRLINFQIQLEALEGFTQSKRTFNFDTMEADTHKRFDALLGIKAVWMLPVFIKNKGAEIIY